MFDAPCGGKAGRPAKAGYIVSDGFKKLDRLLKNFLHAAENSLFAISSVATSK